jgi:hypothetical protein
MRRPINASCALDIRRMRQLDWPLQTLSRLSTYQFSMTSHSFGNGRHFVSNLLM